MIYRKIIALTLTFSIVLVAIGCSGKKQEVEVEEDYSASLPYIGACTGNDTTGFTESYGEELIAEKKFNYNINLYSNEAVPFNDNAKKVTDQIETWYDHMPHYIPMENFIAYYAYEGTASYNDRYLIYKEDGVLKVNKESFDCGDSTFYYGTIDNEVYFLEEFPSLRYKPYKTSFLDGGDDSYGVVIFESRGAIYATPTTNIFSNK
jgi:hypothetical protein